MSGNFEICQGKIELGKCHGKLSCVREKLNFQVYTQRISDSRTSSSYFFLFSYKNVHAIIGNLAPPMGASIYNYNLTYCQAIKFLFF